MTSKNPKHRPTAEKVLNNPIFWDSDKIAKFIANSNDQGDQIEGIKGIFNGNWINSVDPTIYGALKKFRKKDYNGQSNKELLQAVRNSVRNVYRS